MRIEKQSQTRYKPEIAGGRSQQSIRKHNRKGVILDVSEQDYVPAHTHSASSEGGKNAKRRLLCKAHGETY